MDDPYRLQIKTSGIKRRRERIVNGVPLAVLGCILRIDASHHIDDFDMGDAVFVQ